MAFAVERAGLRYGRLVVTARSTKVNRQRYVYWACRCDCGNSADVLSSLLESGRTQSCGCLQRERAAERQTRHGYTGQPDYLRAAKSYYNARRRCENPRDKRYERYGGRGVSVSPEWDTVEAFIADMGPCPPGYSLERIDVDGGYAKHNCVWLPMPLQGKNKAANIMVSHDGAATPLVDYAKIRGVNYDGLKSRIKRRGESPEEAADLMIRHPRSPLKDTTIGRQRDAKGRLLPS